MPVAGILVLLALLALPSASPEAQQESHWREGIGECLRPHIPAIGCGSECDYSNDWVVDNAKVFADALEEFACADGEGFDALEIGSFEGRSAMWFMNSLHLKTMTCVDTWRGGEEMWQMAEEIPLMEKRFDKNMEAANVPDGMLRKIKGDSYSVLPRLMVEKKRYDLIYVDGSHTAEAAMFDAVMGLHLLRVGGIIMFDDYRDGMKAELGLDVQTGVDGFLDAHEAFVKVYAQDPRAMNVLIIRKTREIRSFDGIPVD